MPQASTFPPHKLASGVPVPSKAFGIQTTTILSQHRRTKALHKPVSRTTTVTTIQTIGFRLGQPPVDPPPHLVPDPETNNPKRRRPGAPPEPSEPSHEQWSPSSRQDTMSRTAHGRALGRWGEGRFDFTSAFLQTSAGKNCSLCSRWFCDVTFATNINDAVPCWYYTLSFSWTKGECYILDVMLSPFFFFRCVLRCYLPACPSCCRRYMHCVRFIRSSSVPIHTLCR